MFDAPIGSGAQIFVLIAVGIISIVAGIMHIDIFKEVNKKSSEDKD